MSSRSPAVVPPELCCPLTGQPLAYASREELAALNQRILAGGVTTSSGTAVARPVSMAIASSAWLYPMAHEGVFELTAHSAIAVAAG